MAMERSREAMEANGKLRGRTGVSRVRAVRDLLLRAVWVSAYAVLIRAFQLVTTLEKIGRFTRIGLGRANVRMKNIAN